MKQRHVDTELNPGAQFDGLLRALTQIPKAEVEAEERKWQEQRELLRKKGAAKGRRKRTAGG